MATDMNLINFFFLGGLVYDKYRWYNKVQLESILNGRNSCGLLRLLHETVIFRFQFVFFFSFYSFRILVCPIPSPPLTVLHPIASIHTHSAT